MAGRDACSQVALNRHSCFLFRFDTSRSQPTSTGALVTLDLPAALSQRVMNALKADPRTVDLRAQAPHFYALAARMLELFEEEEMVDVLIEVRDFVVDLYCDASRLIRCGLDLQKAVCRDSRSST